MSQALFFLLVMVCPLMMIWMMRGGHGHGSHSDDGRSKGSKASTEDLYRSRDELNRLIAKRESAEKTPTRLGDRT